MLLPSHACLEQSREGREGKMSACVCVCRASEVSGRLMKHYSIIGAYAILIHSGDSFRDALA
jgi:hypothetical protein